VPAGQMMAYLEIRDRAIATLEAVGTEPVVAAAANPDAAGPR